MTILNTGNLIAADQIIPAVANLYDWHLLERNSKLFATLNNLGRVSAVVPSGSGGTGNYRVYFNKATGMRTYYNTAAAIVPVGPAVSWDLRGAKAGVNSNVGGAMAIDPNGAFTLLNIVPREGMGIRFIGTVEDNAAGTHLANILFRIESVDNAASDWNVRLMSSNLSAAVCENIVSLNAYDGTSLATRNAGGFIMITEVAEFGGEAPDADDMMPSQDWNNLQMYDISYGKNIVAWSQLTKFDNGMNTLLQAVQPRMFSGIDSDILFGGDALEPNNIIAVKDYGTMKGIWEFMNLSRENATTDPAQPVVRVDTGTDIDLWNLVETFADRTTDAPTNVLGVVTSQMDIALLKAANDARAVVRSEMIEFPRMQFNKRTIEIGDYRINLIVDDNLKRHPRMVDAAGNVAGRGYVGLFLSPKDMGIMYHDNAEYGVMIPAVRPVLNARDRRTKEDHMLACLTFGMWNMQNHVAYGITGS